MPVTTEFRFGRCEVHVRRHEIRRDEQIQNVQPKAFELLLLLLRERHRVVARGELVAALWQQQSVSCSVLARTLMKVRQAIGDSAAQPVWIKTVHGYGYRFVGEVIEVRARESAVLAVAGNIAERQRIGVLPCENQTGDPSFDWMQLGLMALAVQALEADARMDVVSMQTLMEALGRLPVDAPTQEQTNVALKALGLAWVAQSSVRKQGNMLWLDYRLDSAEGMTRGGSLRECDPVAMGERFARAICADLSTDENAFSTFESRDPFVHLAFARAIELWSQQQLQSALLLFEMVCDREPGSLMARLWRVRCLVGLCHPAADEEGSTLLAETVECGDALLQLMGHLCVGQSMNFIRGNAEGACAHFCRAQVLANGVSQYWTGQLQLQLAFLAYSRHQIREARQCFQASEAVFRAINRPAPLGQIQLHLAMLEEAEGNLTGALQYAEDGLALLETQHRHADAAMARALLASMHAGQGRLGRARDIANTVIRRLKLLQSPQAAVVCVAAAARVYGEFGDVASLQSVAALGERLTAGAIGPHVEGPKFEVACHLALWRGDLAGLRSTVAKAVAEPRQHPEALLMMYLLLLRTETAAGCFEAAAVVRECIAKHPLAAIHVEAQAAIDRAQAAELLARGDADGALRILLLLIERMPFCREHARSRIDAAWLLVEAGDLPHAAALLAGAGAWPSEHPAGMAAQARLCGALGEAALARGWQQQALGLFIGVAPEVHRNLLTGYAAAPTGAAIRLPCLAHLATDSWLPKPH